MLHLRGGELPEAHPYALEIKALLRPEGAIRAQAVFDVEGVPTVVFVGDDEAPFSSEALDDIRKRIWNQNLVTVVIELNGQSAQILPARKLPNAGERLTLSTARSDGPFSALDVASANLSRRLPTWFDIKARVDRKLLENLSAAVAALSRSGFGDSLGQLLRRHHAELLMGQVLFVSYLEHRDIVGTTYRERRAVGRLHDLIAEGNRDGVRTLIDSLCQDFNGDFLGNDRHDPWAALNDAGFEFLDRFLSRTDIKTGQGDFWNYDFSYIPVELLSGLYESFLSPDEQANDSAYYTPRHLAMLAVDQAFATSLDPLSETIFDGACGSGILLTTAYRRLIALAEARDRRMLSFKERRDLVVQRIFGADINLMACRVTAFSLYLSLLEGLDPADIMEAQEREGVKLPTLDGTNLRHGAQADFFGTHHGFADRHFSLIISNPPWKEPPGASITSADHWAERAEAPFVRRQIAGAYALRTQDFLTEGGRVCLILPIGQFLGPSSASFVAHLLRQMQPWRLINFGDLQNLLFPTAENTCHIFLGALRPKTAQGRIPFGETFDYCVPKADMSLAYGRLTMQSADRHTLQTLSIAQDPQLLVTLMWGDASDLALWTRLSTLGTFRDFWTGPKTSRRWVCRKGVHLEDKSRPAVSAEPLRTMPFIPIEALSAGTPVLHRALLGKWPENQSTVASANKDLLDVFDGPRVLFADGFSRQELSVRAVFFNTPGSFTHSIGVISGPKTDAPLLQFAAVYLRSSLARYFLMMRGWKMLCERNGVHLTDIESFPFFDVEAAPDPVLAQEVLARTSQRMTDLAQRDDFDQARSYETLRDAFDNDVFDFFALSEDERALVRETVEILMPSIRPRSFKSLDTPAQQAARKEDFERYGNALANALTRWRERTGGKGRFQVSVVTSQPRRAGPIGIVRIEYKPSKTAPATATTTIDDQLVQSTLSELRQLGLTIIPSGDALQLVPDAHIWTNGALYLVRPLTRRSWTLRQAVRDAEYIVRTVQSGHRIPKRPEVA
ncbi:MAG: N-6 DNA methylase [Rhodospirillales bacterium]